MEKLFYALFYVRLLFLAGNDERFLYFHHLLRFLNSLYLYRTNLIFRNFCDRVEGRVGE
jgi:hypothetical protein